MLHLLRVRVRVRVGVGVRVRARVRVRVRVRVRLTLTLTLTRLLTNNPFKVDSLRALGVQVDGNEECQVCDDELSDVCRFYLSTKVRVRVRVRARVRVS